MNRTTARVLVWCASLLGTLAAQAPAPNAASASQGDEIKAIVAKMVESERGLKSLRMKMHTSGRLPGDLDVTTAGELRVLRAEQPEVPARRYARLEYSFGEGLSGRLESAETPDGIRLFEEDPAFGPVFLRIGRWIVRDLEWAGRVLDRSDLPGMVDARARAPLGSGLLGDMIRTFDLALDGRGERAGEAGAWIVGRRKAGLDEQDPDLPLADEVEVFVRRRDNALLLARYKAGGAVLQEIVVDELEVGVELGNDDFVVDGRGVRIRSVQDYAPLWEQIEQTLERAEAKAEQGQVRPSQRGGEVRRREAGDDKPGGRGGE
ncbi:MAG: hypothetical protein ACON4Z_10315 [Planctomycetota bacterium]